MFRFKSAAHLLAISGLWSLLHSLKMSENLRLPAAFGGYWEGVFAWNGFSASLEQISNRRENSFKTSPLSSEHTT